MTSSHQSMYLWRHEWWRIVTRMICSMHAVRYDRVSWERLDVTRSIREETKQTYTPVPTWRQHTLKKLVPETVVLYQNLARVSVKLVQVFTARCYAERGVATASRLSVRLSVTVRYRGHIGWKSHLVSMGFSYSADPNNADLLQREHPEILTQSDPPPVEFSVADIRPNGHTMGSV